MRVLAIETSCDETGIALVEAEKIGWSLRFKTLRAALLSQAALHAPYGGVFPNLAKREHQKNLPVLFEQFKDDEYDAVAVTVGPGLEPALWQGVEFAKKLAREKNLPLLPVNHMEAHFISSLVQKNILEGVQTPVLGLLISGGHTEFVLMEQWLSYKIIGQTLDDAVGEAFDKVARMLGLPYPGGPEISKLAGQARATQNISDIQLPRPMLQSKNCDVSFSGLKTAALYALRDKNVSDGDKQAFAKEFEDAVGDVLVAKTRRALEETGAKTFVIGGGVAANSFLREQLHTLVQKEFPEVEIRLPELLITSDNAIMIAQAALARRLSDIKDEKGEDLKAVGNLSIAG